MRFLYHKIDSLPRLAWCAVMHRSRDVIDVFHGPWVEVRDCFFVEGAWDGDFLKGRFDEATSFFGSGMILNNNSVIVCTPTHTREKICSIKSDNEIYISNSIVFLLGKSGYALDDNYEYYQEDLLSIKRGIRDYIKHIPLNRENKISLYYHCNLEIKPNLHMTEIQKNETNKEFTNYDTYKSFLESSVANIFKNANDRNRKIQYKPITTLSSGYDSACCSVLAKRNGCTEALTFVNDTEKSDSGAKIAERLGLHIKEINRKDYLKSKRKFIEAEIFSAGTGISGLFILSLEKHIKSRLLITGYQGDKVWCKSSHKVNSNLENDASGSAYTEFRLRVGFIQFVVPHLGATKFPSIYKISNTEEMKNWSSGDVDYDRPIPTRIIMEENIPRDLFGKSKKGSGISPFIRNKLIQRIIYKIIKILNTHVKIKIRMKNRLTLIITKERYKNIMKEDSVNDLYHYLIRSKNKSISSCKFIWGVARTKNNYQ